MRFLVVLLGSQFEWLFIAATAHGADAELIAQAWATPRSIVDVFDLSDGSQRLRWEYKRLAHVG